MFIQKSVNKFSFLPGDKGGLTQKQFVNAFLKWLKNILTLFLQHVIFCKGSSFDYLKLSFVGGY